MRQNHKISLIRTLRTLCLLPVVGLLATSLFAQDSGSIAKALLALRTLNGNVSTINGRLYAGRIASSITHLGGSVNEVLAGDAIALTLSDPSGRLRDVSCGTASAPLLKDSFDDCVRTNIDSIVKILFPASLSLAASGKNAGQNHAQVFLLTTALGLATPNAEGRRRSDIGGLVEREWFSDDNLSGQAWQGLYQFSRIPLSVQGRYARQHDAVDTRSLTASVDYHPSWIIDPTAPFEWRVGVDARSGIVYARSSSLESRPEISPLDLGSIDIGGGVWTSARKDFSRIRVGGGTLFQGTKSHVPASLAGDDLAFVAQSMNHSPVAFDLTYGGLVGFLTSERTSVNGRFMQTHSVAPDAGWPRPPARLAMVSFSYLFKGVTPIDAGYKVSTTGGIAAHSIFVQGNFR